MGSILLHVSNSIIPAKHHTHTQSSKTNISLTQRTKSTVQVNIPLSIQPKKNGINPRHHHTRSSFLMIPRNHAYAYTEEEEEEDVTIIKRHPDP
jgi:hypothetical protein